MLKSTVLIALVLTYIGLNAQNSEIMKPINSNAPVSYQSNIIIHADKDKVWEALANINNWPAWHSDIKEAKIQGELSAGTQFKWKSGGMNITSKLHTVRQNEQLGWTGKAMGVYAIHNWTLLEDENGTKIIVEESMEGFMAKLLRKSFNKVLKKGLDTWLEQLKTEVEKTSNQ